MPAPTLSRLLLTTALLALSAAAHAAPPSAALDAAAAPRQAQPPSTLKRAYASAFRIGTAVNDDIVAGRDARSQALVPRHFDAITAENVMKAEVLHPAPDTWEFDAADAFVDFGQRQGQFIVGHTLVWHNQTPDWFFHDAAGAPLAPDAMASRLRDYVATVAGRYVGRVHAWDVVNEIVGEDGAYRDTVWTRALGDGDTVVRDAFAAAARAAPDAELYYNDFNTWRPAKRAGIVRLVTMLQDAGIRIDGVGMQAHWGLHYPSLDDIEASIDAYAALGVKVMITELDIDVLPLTREGQVIGTGLAHPQFQLEEFERYLDPYPDGLPADVERQLAQRYAELFALFYRKRDVIDRVTVWGVHDGMSWKNDYPVPNRTNYPLLFDRDRQPKPALDAVLAMPETTTR
ncbi:endo-1,4-beta-xylanase [Luteimonas sp. TWI1416]|uniref:endo-1,4-beta-xylanase n=1 Tax=unclassified Luteimonas TaxID=2629088 RepID=UPI0032086D06